MSMEAVEKLLRTNEVVRAITHEGETVYLRKRGCEGSFARPGYFWHLRWHLTRMVEGKSVEYEKSIVVWEPCTDEDIEKALDRLEADARRCLWGSSPSE